MSIENTGDIGHSGGNLFEATGGQHQGNDGVNIFGDFFKPEEIGASIDKTLSNSNTFKVLTAGLSGVFECLGKLPFNQLMSLGLFSILDVFKATSGLGLPNPSSIFGKLFQNNKNNDIGIK